LARHIFNKDRKRFTHSAALAKIMEMDDLTIVHAYQTLTVGVADPEVAEHLKVGLGEPTADCRWCWSTATISRSTSPTSIITEVVLQCAPI